MIKVFEVRIETPAGRYLNVLVAASDAAEARDTAVGMLEDFRGAASHAFRVARAEATTAVVDVKELTKHTA